MSIVERFDGDAELVGQLVSLFLAECPRMLDEVRAAFTAGQAEQLSRAAHAFKGSVANFAEGGVVAAAQALELSARDGRLDEAPALLHRLEAELGRLLEVLREFEGVDRCAS